MDHRTPAKGCVLGTDPQALCPRWKSPQLEKKGHVMLSVMLVEPCAPIFAEMPLGQRVKPASPRVTR